MSQTIALGARLSRYDLNVTQTAKARNAAIDGLALIAGRQLADTHTTHRSRAAERPQRAAAQDASSAAPRTRCSTARSWCARARSSPTRRSRAATCCCRDKARVDTKPQLEIFADDVKCAHGATVGQLDAEQLFYLRSRGLPDARRAIC